MPADPSGVAEEANRLYWHTDMPVAEISNQLDLSRRALYEALQPLPADTVCGICGAVQSYANRSARNARDARCLACAERADTAERAAQTASVTAGAAEPAAAAVATAASPAGRAPSGSRASAPAARGNGIGRGDEVAAVESDELAARAIRLTTAALLGAAVGAGAALVATRRR